MKKHLTKTLSVRLPLLFVASMLIITGVMIPLVYRRFHARMVDQYSRMGEGATKLMANAFDADKVDEYIEHNFDLPEYVDTVDYLYTLRDSYPDILYMYIYRFEEDGGHVIIDLDADWWVDGEGYEPGYLWSLDEIEEPFASHLSEVAAGKQIAGYSELTKADGYLFTYTRPIFRDDGSYACTACVDFSMDYLSGMDREFTFRLALIVLIIGAIILILDFYIVRKRITTPINKLSKCANSFSYDTEEDRKRNLQLLDDLNIHTGDEIEDVYHVLQSVTHDSYRATSKLVQAQEDLSEALVRAKEASAAKTAFLSSMSHEIRTPMNAIIGLDSIALKDPTISDATRDELEKIGSSAKHLLSLINDILDMSRIESGRMTLSEEEFSFHEMVEQIDVMIHGQCQEKNLTYESRIIGKVDDYFIGDALRIRQIIINILGNSVKFTYSPGTVSFSVVQISDTEDRCTLHFMISDTGIGIDKEFLPKLFESFTQEDATTTNRYGGSGLGMALTKSMVELMGGTITVDSEKDVGTTFTVDIPLHRTHHVDVAEDPEPLDQPVSEISLTGRHLLIAEDMAVNAQMLIMMLEMEGITSEWAENGQFAVEMFAKSEPGHFDAILMDMRMPVMDGVTATREIRKLDRPDAQSIPIIALTANAFGEDVAQCLDAGMNAHLSKPVDMDLIKNELSAMLG